MFKTDLGISPLKFSVGDTYSNTSIGSGITLNLQIDYLIESIFSSIGIYYHTIIGSNYGLIPLNEVGISITYYPYDYIKETVMVDNQVSIIIRKVIPFISFNSGIASFSINDKDLKTSFNSLLIDLSVLAGVMFPYGKNMFFNTSVGFQKSFGGTGSSTGEEEIGIPSISFNSVLILLGFSFIP
jgi:hypothetical protein